MHSKVHQVCGPHRRTLLDLSRHGVGAAEPRSSPAQRGPATSIGSVVSLLEEEAHGSVELLEGPIEAHVMEIRLIEKLEEIESIPSQTLIVFGRSLSTQMDGYMLDVAVRRALSREAAGIAVIGDPVRNLSMTARAMCRRSGLGLLRLSSAQDVNIVLHGLALQLVDELHLTIGRARRACEVIAASVVTDPVELARAVSGLLTWQIDVGPAPDTSDANFLAIPVVYSEPQGAHFVSASPQGADARTLLDLVLSRMSLQLTAGAAVERTQLFSASEVLRQVISGDAESRDELAPLAQRLGIPVGHWHVAIRLEFVAGRGRDERMAFERREHLARVALAAARAGGGTWHVAQEPDALVLLYSTPTPMPGAIGPRLQRVAISIREALLRPAPDFHAHVGIGSARKGLTGIASSATEAHLAATHARSTRRMDEPVCFDAVGIRTTVVEWYGSPTVQQSIDALFAPLDRLSQSRRHGTVEILGTYLDCGGSISRTADLMHLHRNAVRARLNRAVATLDIDLEDPDQRLFVHLACRSRSMMLSPRT